MSKYHKNILKHKLFIFNTIFIQLFYHKEIQFKIDISAHILENLENKEK